MPRRRTFLQTAGVTALAGLTSLAGCNTQSSPSTTGTSTTTTTPENTGNETATTTEENQRTDTSRFHLGATSVLEDFEDLGPWSASGGSIQADTETAFRGSQSLRITAPKGTNAAWAVRDVDWDLSGKTLSLAFDPTKPVEKVLVEVRLVRADDTTLTMGELVRVPANQGWMRLDLATSRFTGGTDLSKIRRVELGMRAAAGAIDFNVDDLRTVPRPETGSVVLTFDDALESHYTEALPRLREYDMPGNAAIITGSVGSKGSLTLDEMGEMRDAGWAFANHSTTKDRLTSLSTQELWLNVNDASDYLTSHGFDGDSPAFVYPSGSFNEAVLQTVGETHDLGFRYMAPLSAATGAITDPLTIGRGNAAANLTHSKTMVTYAEQLRNTVVLTFHDIAEDAGGLGMTPGTFQQLVDYISRRNVDVITMSDLAKNHLAD